MLRCFQLYGVTNFMVFPTLRCFQLYGVSNFMVFPTLWCFQLYGVFNFMVFSTLWCFQLYGVSNFMVLPNIRCYGVMVLWCYGVTVLPYLPAPACLLIRERQTRRKRQIWESARSADVIHITPAVPCAPIMGEQGCCRSCAHINETKTCN